VLATSNDTTKLDAALLQRFGQPLQFTAGSLFAAAAMSRLRDVWETEAIDVPPPPELSSWGWQGETYSLRVALDQLQDYLSLAAAA
jgi:hypothetical protein